MAADPIDNAYWLRRWKEGDTGWHQKEPEAALLRHFGDPPPTCVLVPLCGKSLDLNWLASRGHDVLGVELSPLACESFFSDQKLPVETRPAGHFTRYSSPANPQITILQGDFFQLRSSDLPPIGAIYDRAALIALPAPLRARYVTQLSDLARTAAAGPGFRFLALVLERTPHDAEGPPYSVPEPMFRSLYQHDFTIELLEREDAELEAASGARTDQVAYRLTRNRA